MNINRNIGSTIWTGGKTTLMVTKHWNRLSREAVDSPSLEIFKAHLNIFLYKLSREPDLAKFWTRWSSEVLSNAHDSVILWLQIIICFYLRSLSKAQASDLKNSSVTSWIVCKYAFRIRKILNACIKELHYNTDICIYSIHSEIVLRLRTSNFQKSVLQNSCKPYLYNFEACCSWNLTKLCTVLTKRYYFSTIIYMYQWNISTP